MQSYCQVMANVTFTAEPKFILTYGPNHAKCTCHLTKRATLSEARRMARAYPGYPAEVVDMSGTWVAGYRARDQFG